VKEMKTYPTKGETRSEKNRKRKEKLKQRKTRSQKRLGATFPKEKRLENTREFIGKFVNNRIKNKNEDEKSMWVKTYIRFVKDCLNERKVIIDDGDIAKSYNLSTRGGGQRRDRKRTAVKLTHLPTMISTSIEDLETQTKNEKRAAEVLKQKLEKHLEIWQTLIDKADSDVGSEVFAIVDQITK